LESASRRSSVKTVCRDLVGDWPEGGSEVAGTGLLVVGNHGRMAISRYALNDAAASGV
jgi:hypothetical protein